MKNLDTVRETFSFLHPKTCITGRITLIFQEGRDIFNLTLTFNLKYVDISNYYNKA